MCIDALNDSTLVQNSLCGLAATSILDSIEAGAKKIGGGAFEEIIIYPSIFIVGAIAAVISLVEATARLIFAGLSYGASLLICSNETSQSLKTLGETLWTSVFDTEATKRLAEGKGFSGLKLSNLFAFTLAGAFLYGIAHACCCSASVSGSTGEEY